MTTQKISSAFVAAQKAFGPALKTNTNPHFKSKYADLSACIEAVIDALHANGIAMIQKTINVDSGVCVETVFVHDSGETLSSGPLHVPAAKQDPQGYGSALTYARRYSLMAACGIAPEDDDGNAGTKAARDQGTPNKATSKKPDEGSFASYQKISDQAAQQANKNDPAAIEVAVADGRAADVALHLVTLNQTQLDKVWSKLKPETQDQIISKWPG